MKYTFIFSVMCVATVIGWSPRPRVRHHIEFFTQVMQETVYEMEKIGFSTLRLVNVTQNIDMQMYKWHINGTAVYTDGFLISIQKIDLTAMNQAVGSPTINGVVTHRASVTGTLNFRDAKVGYDVIFTPVNGSPHTYTGDFTHSVISFGISINKNMTTNEITATMTSGLSGSRRMVYRPTSNVTEVLSRQFRPFHTLDGVQTWSNTLIPIILDVVKNKVPFPSVCFSHC